MSTIQRDPPTEEPKPSHDFDELMNGITLRSKLRILRYTPTFKKRLDRK